MMVNAIVEHRWREPHGFGETVCRGWGLFRTGERPGDAAGELVLVTADATLARGLCATPNRPIDLGFERGMTDWRHGA